MVIGTQAHPKPGGQSSTQNSWDRFELLYRSSRDDIFAYVATLLNDRAAAEDITALAFERAYRRRMTFDRRRGEERAWLVGIAGTAAPRGARGADRALRARPRGHRAEISCGASQYRAGQGPRHQRDRRRHPAV